MLQQLRAILQTLPYTHTRTQHHRRTRILHRPAQGEEEQQCLAAAAAAPPLYVFPARLEELAILQHAVERAPGDARSDFSLCVKACVA
jgi:fatty acid desaturase